MFFSGERCQRDSSERELINDGEPSRSTAEWLKTVFIGESDKS